MKNIFVAIALLSILHVNHASGQKYQYIQIQEWSTTGLFYYRIDTSGLRPDLKEPIKEYVQYTTDNPDYRFKNFNQLFNFLGDLGWEIYSITYTPWNLSNQNATYYVNGNKTYFLRMVR